MGRPSKAAQHASRAAQAAPGQYDCDQALPKQGDRVYDAEAFPSTVREPASSETSEDSRNPRYTGDFLDDPLLTVEEVSLWLRKPKGTLYAWRSRGLGPRAHKVGNDLRYPRSEVTRWLERNFDVRGMD